MVHCPQGGAIAIFDVLGFPGVLLLLVVLRCRCPVRQRLISRQQQVKRAEQRETQSTFSGQNSAQSGRQPRQAAGSVSRAVGSADHVCQVCPFI